MSDKIRCIIVEDEPLAAKVLRGYIEQVPFLDLQEVFKDAIAAGEYLRDHAVQLIFLDIHLPKLRGMAFIKTLSQPPAIIVTTAYYQYAVEGFELNVTDYLLKPFDFQRFFKAVNRVKTAQEERQQPMQAPTEPGAIFLSVQKRKVKIQFADILYIESQREYVKVVTGQKEYLSKLGTGELEAILPPHLFRRIHRSFIVSLGKIEAYTAEAVEVNGVCIPIGRGYREALDTAAFKDKNQR
jgi:two-component system, LytTR family, response regulator